jgi:hypothetical protein
MVSINCGYELYEASAMSGRPLYNYRRRGGFHGSAPERLLENRAVLTDPAVLQDHLDRIRRSVG